MGLAAGLRPSAHGPRNDRSIGRGNRRAEVAGSAASVGDEAAFNCSGLDRLLQFFEGTHLDLAHALARDAVLLRQVFKRRRVLLQTPLGQDVALAIVQMRHRLFEQIAPQPKLLALAERGLLALALIDEPILPLALAVGAQWRVQRMIG